MQPDEVFADRYRIRRVISAGQMATVCAASHILTRQRVVLKLVRGTGGSDALEPMAWQVRFRREVRAASGIESDHAVKILDAGTDAISGISYIAMEELEGDDLSEAMRFLGRFPPDLAMRIVAQACDAVQAAHHLRVVHRDIKPGNLFLAENKDGTVTVKLLDFGLAKAISDSAGLMSLADITDTGGVLGTPNYMSPEQAKDSRSVDERTDIWSLGAVLYRMLSGRSPFAGPHGAGGILIELAVGTSDPEPIQKHAPWVSPELAAVVHRALQRDLTRRYATVEDMRADLLMLLDGDDSLKQEDIRSLSGQERQVVARPVRQQDLRFDQPRVITTLSAKLPTTDCSWLQGCFGGFFKQFRWFVAIGVLVGAVAAAFILFKTINLQEKDGESAETMARVPSFASTDSAKDEHDFKP